jgi:hemolysin III
MAKNKRYWKTMLAGSDDKKHAATTGEDPLEEGLKDLTWFESSKRAVQRGLHKTYETFGEEVGNSLTAGVPALYLLGLLPFAAINSYISVSATDATPAHVVMSVIAISAFIVTLFLALLMSTIYHLMKHGTPHKRVMNKVNRSVAYFAILGAYTPICINILSPISGAVLWALEAAMAIAGVLVTALAYHTKVGKSFTYFIYAAMGWAIIFRIVEFYRNTTPVCFWLLLSGAIVYTIGIFFAPSKRRFKFSHMVWHFFVLAGVVLHVLGFVYFFQY